MQSLGGYVTSPKMFIGRNNIIDEDGLMSQRIFGPISSYKCLCGKLSMSLDRGKICPNCGVICESKNLRVKTFGKIKLIFPIIHINKITKLKKIFKNKVEKIIDPIFSDSTRSEKLYLGLTPKGDNIKIIEDFHDKKYYVIPLRITGIYSFVLCLKYIVNNFKGQISIADEISNLFDDNVISDVMMVLPPEIRPVVSDPKKPTTLRVTPVNKHYTSLLQLNKSFSMIKSNIEIDEENWLKMIDVNFREQLNEEIVELGIIEYDEITSRYQYYSNLVYETVYELISKKKGFIRSLILSKTLEFSARSVIRAEPGIEPYQIKVSKKILYKLWRLHFIHYLTNIKEIDYDVCFEEIVSKDYEDVKNLFDEFLEWFCK